MALRFAKDEAVDLDLDGDGRIDGGEMNHLVSEMGSGKAHLDNRDEVEHVVQRSLSELDQNADGAIDKDELM